MANIEPYKCSPLQESQKERKRRKSGEEERGTKWIQWERPHNTDCCLMLEPHHCSVQPPPSQKHQPVRDKWEHNPVLPAVVGIHLNRDAAKQPVTAKAPWAKIIRIAHGGIPAKKYICNQETAPIYQTFAADPHHFCITGNSQVSYELHLALPFLGLAQTAESHIRTRKMPPQ